MTVELILAPGIREDVLAHLKRAGHDELGTSHLASDDEKLAGLALGDLVQNRPGCNWGMWLVDDAELIDKEDAPRTQCSECVCGYSGILNLFEPGKEEGDRLAKIE